MPHKTNANRLLLVDAHCHLSLNPEELDAQQNIEPIFGKFSQNDSLILNVMTTTHKDDQILSRNTFFGKNAPKNVKIGVGIHPWYCHRYTLDGSVTKMEHYTSVLELGAQEKKGNDLFPEGNKLNGVSEDSMECNCLNGENSETKSSNCDNKEQNAENSDLKRLLAEHLDQLPDPVDVSAYYSDAVLSRYDFVGEVGLDFTANIIELCNLFHVTTVKVKQEHQLAILRFFIDSAVKHSFFLSIHSVNAKLATHNVLQEYDSVLTKTLTVVIHSYTGTAEQFNQQYLRFKNIETYISLSGYINLKEPLSKKMTKLIQQVDPSRMLLETDVPLNRDFNFEKDLLQSLTKIAELKNMNYIELNNHLNKNYASLKTQA